MATATVTPRWPTNSDGIEAPEGICGDYNCQCAERARMILTAHEYRLAFGVPKEFGLADWIRQHGPSEFATAGPVHSWPGRLSSSGL
jgi:hypothetical protein